MRRLAEIKEEIETIEWEMNARDLERTYLARLKQKVASDSVRLACILASRHVTSSGGLTRALKTIPRILKFLGSHGKIFKELKEFLGDITITRIKDLAKHGGVYLKKILAKMIDEFPLAVILNRGKYRVTVLSEIVEKILLKSELFRKVMENVEHLAEKIHDIILEHLPDKLSRLANACVFIWIWTNMTEISWDTQYLIKGFLGHVPIKQTLGALPVDFGIETVIALLFGHPNFLPIMLAFRLVWLGQREMISFESNGIRINWEKLGLKGTPPETVPA